MNNTDKIIFCNLCNERAYYQCSLCGKYFCSNHVHKPIDDFEIKDFNSLDLFMRMLLRLRKFQLAGHTNVFEFTDFTRDSISGTFRYFFENCFSALGSLHIEGGTFCGNCFPPQLQNITKNIQRYLSASSLQKLKKERKICSEEYCIIDGSYTCGTCGKSYCMYHSLRCGKCNKNFCCSAKEDGRPNGGCAVAHSHGFIFSSTHW